MPNQKRKVILPFESTPNQIEQAMRKLMESCCEGLLDRAPSRAELSLMRQQTNQQNLLLVDFIYDDAKIGTVSTTYRLDIPRCIMLEFSPI